MPNQNNGNYQGQQDKTNNQPKDTPQAGAKDNQWDKKNPNPSGASGQSPDKKNLSGSDSDSE
jgi:hypothetical protein